MRLLITDSGVGGLSVCAAVERHLRRSGNPDGVRLTYVNASPENDFGYNAMGSRQEKLEHFDRYLHIIAERFAPDAIYIACNTLSVLLEHTSFFAGEQCPVHGIVETGVRRLGAELAAAPELTAMVFGTPTTIAEGSYSALLAARGITTSRVISQACHSLADTISEDRQGELARAKIFSYVEQAVAQLGHIPGACLGYLACTHYGYRAEHFAAAYLAAGLEARILNPNELVVDELFGPSVDSPVAGRVEVEFFTRYRIPEAALETIAHFLAEISPATVRAFQNYTWEPNLF